MRGKKKKLPLPLRVILLLAAAGILVYCGIIGYVCILEGNVTRELEEVQDCDAIIVLGAQVKPDGELSVQLQWRLDKAFEAYGRKPVPIVVCGAQGKDEPTTEAEAMKRYLAGKGVTGTILEDPESFNTNENLENAKVLLEALEEEQGIVVRRVLIVTSDYHLPRAMAIARDLGYEAEGLGSECKPEFWLKNHAREALAWCKYWAKKYLRLPL